MKQKFNYSFYLIIISLFFVSFLIPEKGIGAEIKQCSDYGEGYDCRQAGECDPHYTISDYTICGPTGYLYCCKAKNSSPPPAGLTSCSDYGGFCTEHSLCSMNKGTIITGTDCETTGEICCVSQTPIENPPTDENQPTEENQSLVFQNPLSPVSDIWQLIDHILYFVFLVSIPLTVLIILYAAFLFITSSGIPERVKTAQKVLTWAIIGFIIVLIANYVPDWIYEMVTGKKLETNLENNNTDNTTGGGGGGGGREYYTYASYPQTKISGGFSYNANTLTCSWSETIDEDDPRCTDDLLAI